ncbi:MAG: sigma-54 dependent transcriptional regulator [Acidobacteriia bacterium]|nr:sigma-54 dependent transcriptional regulator [Terriglobia bacterium]
MADTRPTLLVVDDEPGIIAMVERFARIQGFDVIAHAGGRQLVAELPTMNCDVALVDLRMPEVSGLDVLRAIRDADPACQVILMTAHASVESAIEAVKLGALDYLSKPFDFERLGELLTNVREGLERRRRLLTADRELASRFQFCGMVGRSPVMQELFDIIRRLAPHVRTALVTGETGTGKELVARALHKLGGRRDKRFVASNCSAIVESLFESELFGHTRGAFTGASEAKPGMFELADGGTLFLDEIGELPLVMQAKLLRVVEYGEVQRVGATDTRRVDVRVIAATNRDLREEVRLGRFRQDLYYRLNIVEIALPPLRDRREDISYLAAAFIQDFAARFGKSIVGMSPGAERLLSNAPWPGNVRELRNTLERACMLTDGRMLSEREVLSALGGAARPAVAAPATASAQVARIAPPPRDLDRSQLEEVLQRVGGNKSAAARELGVSRRALYRRLENHGLH